MISKPELIEMFSDIAEQTSWDMKGEMLWGFFFVDADRSKLEALSVQLEEMGYDVLEIEEEDDDDGTLSLQVVKIEIHTPDTLFERTQELSECAQKLGIGPCTGVDVGSLDEDDEVYEEDN